MTKKMIYDVIIIGAGPAGVQCAIKLANQDISTLIISRTFPCYDQLEGHSFCVEHAIAETFAKNNAVKFARLDIGKINDTVVDVDIDHNKYWRVSSETSFFTSKNIVLSTGSPVLSAPSRIFSSFEDIEYDCDGCIVTDDSYRATYRNLYAAGAVAAGYVRTLSCAIGAGDGVGRHLVAHLNRKPRHSISVTPKYI